MTPALLAALASALDLTADEAAGLELVVHVSASGRSHVEPGLRLFAYRGATPLASVKRLARPSDATRARLLDCYARLADCQAFRVPSLLGWGADDVHLYVVESLVPGHSLAEQLGRGTLAAEEATARLSAVLAALWERGVPATAEEIGRHAAILQHTAATVFADQRARDLVGAVLDILRAQHPTTLRRVLTTRDVHVANVHVDADGQTWLTDFDLTDEVVFGLDVVRT
ncbi:MAG: phosphotransferase [Candidatus Binatia bacterium]